MSSKQPYTLKTLVMSVTAMFVFPVIAIAQVEQLGSYMSTATTSSGSFSFTDIPTFDTSLGTLTGVYLSLTLDSKSLLAIENHNGVSESFSHASASFTPATVTLSLDGNNLLMVSDPATRTSLASGTIGPDMTRVDSNGPIASDTRNTLLLTNFSAFESTSGSTVPLDLSFLEGLGSYTGTAAGGVFFGGADQLKGCLSIDYLYTCNCVPEPSSVVLAAFSIAALFLVRRFKFKRA